MRARIVVLVALAACDLRHADQRAFCATADPARCASRPDWCMALGGASCVAAVEGANCSQCAPAAGAAPCTPKPTLAASCAHDAPRLRDGAFHPLGEWDWTHLDRATLEPTVGRTLARSDVEALSEHDRRMVCGPGTGGDWTGRLPCRLDWSVAAERAECVVDEAFCATDCVTRVEEQQCIALNLCSDVICL